MSTQCFQNRLGRFLRADDGAVTTDWFMLTAGIVGLVLGAFGAVRTGVTDLSSQIGASIHLASPETESSFTYTLLSLSDADADRYIVFYTANNTDSQLQQSYSTRVQNAITAMSSGQDAAEQIDYAHIFEQALINRDLAPVSQHGVSVQDLVVMYHAL